MSTLSSSKLCPCIVWEIKDVFSPNRDETTRIFCFEDKKLRLRFKRIFCQGQRVRHFELQVFLQILESETPFKSLQVFTYIKEKLERSSIQSNYIQRDSYDQFSRVWNMHESDLRTSGAGNNLTFICMIEYQSIAEEDKIEDKGEESVQNCPLHPEPHINKCLESLSIDFQTLLEKGVQSDIILKSKDHKIPAQKTILAARSEVFSAMFRNDMVEKESGVVNINDIDGDILHQFVMYIYTGKLSNLSVVTVQSLYMAADKYAVESLKKRCISFMLENLNEQNALDFLNLADTHDDKELKESVISFIIKTETLLKSENWISFWENQPQLALEVYRVYVKYCSTQNY